MLKSVLHNLKNMSEAQKLTSQLVQELQNVVKFHFMFMICMRSGLDIITTLLGVLKLQSVFCYISEDEVNSNERLSYLKQKINFNACITDSLEVVKKLKKSYNLKSQELTSLRGYLIIFNEDIVSGPLLEIISELVYIVKTSGSTGVPKIVYVPYRCIIPNITHLSRLFKQSPSDLVLLSSPLTFDPSYVQIFTTFYCGSCLLVVDDNIKSQPNMLLDLITKKHQITILHATPALLSLYSPSKLRASLLSSTSKLRILTLGGEQCPTISTLRKWKHENNKTKIFNLYGITEVSCWATCHEVTFPDQLNYNGHEIDEIPIGDALEGTILRLMSPDDDDVDDDDVDDDDGRKILEERSVDEGVMWIGGQERTCWIDDEIYINNIGENVECARGSRALNTGCQQINPKGNLTNTVMRCSGDVVKKVGDKYFVMGRCDDVFKRMGKRMNLIDIQQVLCKLEGLNNCIALYENKRLIVFVQMVDSKIHENDDSLDSVVVDGITKREDVTRIVQDCIKLWLPEQYKPDEVVLIQNIPITHHGKVHKKILLNLYNDFIQECSSQISLLHTSSTQVIQYFFSLCSRKLNILETYLVDNIIKKKWSELGGDSLSALSVHNEMCLQFHYIGESLLDKILNGECMKVSVDYINQCYENKNKDAKKIMDEQCDYDIDSNLNSISKSLDAHQGNVDVKEILDNKEYFSIIGRCIKLQMFHYVRSITDVNNPISQTANNHCVIHQHYTKLKGRILPKLKLTAKWGYDTGKCVDASPLALSNINTGEGNIFIGSHSHKFVSLDLNSGAQKWVVELEDRIEASACLSLCIKYVIVACYSGYIYKINVSNGEVIWRYKTGNSIKCTPCLDIRSGLIYFGSHDGCVYGLDLEKEQCLWKKNLHSGSVFSSPCLSYHDSFDNDEDVSIEDNKLGNDGNDDRNSRRHYNVELVVGTLGGMMCGMNTSTGDLYWSLNLNKPIFSSPTITHHSYVVGCTDGFVYAINKYSHNIIWKYKTGGPIFSTASFVSTRRSREDSVESGRKNGLLLIGSHDKHLHCIDSKTGTCVWKSELDSEIYSTPCLFNSFDKLSIAKKSDEQDKCNNVNKLYDEVDTLAVCSTKGLLTVFNIYDGLPLAEYQLKSEVFSSPCYIQGMLIVGCRDNNVYCFHVETQT